jgi:hypothetical protein
MMLAIPFKDIVVVLHQLHPLPSDPILPLIFYYQPKDTFILDKILFA